MTESRNSKSKLYNSNKYFLENFKTLTIFTGNKITIMGKREDSLLAKAKMARELDELCDIVRLRLGSKLNKVRTKQKMSKGFILNQTGLGSVKLDDIESGKSSYTINSLIKLLWALKKKRPEFPWDENQLELIESEVLTLVNP